MDRRMVKEKTIACILMVLIPCMIGIPLGIMLGQEYANLDRAMDELDRVLGEFGTPKTITPYLEKYAFIGTVRNKTIEYWDSETWGTVIFYEIYFENTTGYLFLSDELINRGSEIKIGSTYLFNYTSLTSPAIPYYSNNAKRADDELRSRGTIFAFNEIQKTEYKP